MLWQSLAIFSTKSPGTAVLKLTELKATPDETVRGAIVKIQEDDGSRQTWEAEAANQEQAMRIGQWMTRVRSHDLDPRSCTARQEQSADDHRRNGGHQREVIATRGASVCASGGVVGQREGRTFA